MTHDALLQGDDGADRFDEHNQPQTDEWRVHRDSLVVKNGQAKCISTFLVPRPMAFIEALVGGRADG